jgi:hypothetical protein
MGWACNKNCEKKNAYKLLMRMPEGKRPLRRSRRVWISNIILDLGELEGAVVWIRVAQNGDK